MISKVFMHSKKMYRDQYGNPRGEEHSGTLYLVAWAAVEALALASHSNL
jgi:hypothetical protein